MQSLDEKKRDIFEVVGKKGLFSVEKQSIKLSEQDLSGTGQIPVFSSQTSNNGVMGFTNKVANFFIKDTPALIFGDHTKSMDISNHSFCTADNVKVLRPHNIPFDALLYVSCAWKKRIPDMGYSRHWRKAKKVGIELPVTDSGEPDYEYMAAYVQQKRDAMLAKYRAYVEERIAELGEAVEIPALDEKEWNEYALEELFSVGAGKRLTNADKIDGNRPFVGATDNSNGITGFVGNRNTSCDKNVLGVNYNGAPCIAFYHPYECIFTDDVKRLHLLHHKDNEYVLLFFKVIVMQQRTKYSYGYKFKEKRMLRQKLMLPVDDDGKPDYAYMEQYVKNMMLRKYKQYLAFIDKQNAAEEVTV